MRQPGGDVPATIMTPNVDATATATPHVSVCICTYRRPHFLKHLLEELACQETDGRFNYSIVVVDNDRSESAKAVVLDFSAASAVPIKYCNESRQNIALARNKAVENASGDFVAFIDDDEFPIKRWLLTLFEACDKYDVDGVLGPVKPHFDEPPPEWVVKGRFYDRATYPTGFVIDWKKGRTGNVLLRRRIFSGDDANFDPKFLTGEDQDFFGRMIEKGRVFIWCNEAVAYETVPPVRWTRAFMLKRALLGGAISPIHPSFGALNVAKSLVAVPAYTAGLPFALILGQDRFMSCLIKLCDHLGGLLALLGIRPIKDQYVTE
jgi:glycosyltransferase involved in cell wall biosynthesis